MPKYIIHMTDGSHHDRTIDARDEQEATRTALVAMSVHISTKFPPPANLEIVIMDEQLKTRAMLRFGYEVPMAVVRSLQ